MKKHLPVIAVIAVFVAVMAPAAVALSPAMSMLNSISPISCATTPTKIQLPSTVQPARSICVQNMEAVDVYVGGPDVTTSNGFKVQAGTASAPTNWCFDAQTGWCVVASSTSPIRVVAGNGYSGK